MENLNNNLVSIQSQLIRVDEIIEKKHLKKFIYTSLELRGIKINKSVKIIYNYIKEIKTYQIIIYNKNVSTFLFILNKFSNTNGNSLKIVVCENNIYLFKNGKFYFFQELDYYLKEEEIQELIYSKLNLVVEEILFFNLSKVIDKKINQKELSEKLNYIKKNNFSSLFSFSTFVIIISGIFFGLYFKNNFDNNHIRKSVEKKEFELKKLIESKQKDLQIISLIVLFENIKKLSVVLTNLTYENKLYTLTVESTKEKSLYDLMSLYKKTVKLNKLQYHPERKKYELHIQIRDN